RRGAGRGGGDRRPVRGAGLLVRRRAEQGQGRAAVGDVWRCGRRGGPAAGGAAAAVPARRPVRGGGRPGGGGGAGRPVTAGPHPPAPVGRVAPADPGGGRPRRGGGAGRAVAAGPAAASPPPPR